MFKCISTSVSFIHLIRGRILYSLFYSLIHFTSHHFRYCNYCNYKYDLDLNQTFIQKRDLAQHQFEGENGTETKFLEVIYVADQYAIEQYGMAELPEMLMSMGNTVRIVGLFHPFICFHVFK